MAMSPISVMSSEKDHCRHRIVFHESTSLGQVDNYYNLYPTIIKLGFDNVPTEIQCIIRAANNNMTRSPRTAVMSSPIREPFSLHHHCYILLLILCLFLVPLKTSPTPTTEAQALIRWKTSLVFHSSLLNSWALTKISSLCEWNGITCDNGGSVTEITLTDMNLSGTLDQFDFTAFPNLTHFVLDHNNLNGKIPSAIASLSKLIFLDLSGNNFYDGIPPEIGKLSEIGFLNLYANSLEGPVPYQISSLQKVWFMDLGSNLLTSFDSSRFSSMPYITHLSLSYNNFSGKFPPFIFKCKNLTYLDMSSNGFDDLFPDVMTNLVRLEYLNLTSNAFRGLLPANLSKLASLKHLRIGANEFTRKIPDDIGQLVMLERLDLHAAGLTSIIPSELGRCTNLTFMDLSLNSLAGVLPLSLSNLNKISELDIHENFLSGRVSSYLVGNWTQLISLQLQSNSLIGTIPQEIGMLGKLIFLFLNENRISGQVPQQIGNLENLKLLDLSRNELTGQIPHTIWNLTQLTMLNLFDNILTGSIPPEIGNLTALQTLDIGGNELSECLKNCSRLTIVGVQGNKLSGDISSALGVHPNLDYINLGRNQFSGELSQNWWDYKELTNFHMDGNRISGGLPAQIRRLKNLKFLTLSSNKLTGSIPVRTRLLDLNVQAQFECHNALSGTIPRDLGNLTLLDALDLSHNALSGQIPPTLSQMLSLMSVDFSYNNLTGPIPAGPAFRKSGSRPFLGNPGLCGDAEGLPSCNPINPGERSTEHPKNTKRHKNLVIPIVVPIAGLIVIIIFVVGIVIFLRTTKGSREEFVSTKRSKSFESLAWEREGKFTFNDIVKGTDNFNEMYCIGKGEFGIIYKAMLQTVKLYGFYSKKGCIYLVYDFVERGSLGKVLHKDAEGRLLDWATRIKIIQGVANAIAYLHHDCSPSIVHQDISIDNVMLDERNTARLSGFGKASLLNSDSSNGIVATGLMATRHLVIEKCDVYSFGVVVLEVIMGRHPGELVSSISSSEYQDQKLKDILDQRLQAPTDQLAEEVVFVVKLAMACTCTDPESRPTMLVIAHELSTHIQAFLPEPFDAITMKKLTNF
ncbi:hypothetical protein Syun_030191 [Stephania yunnanensis]|uniref:non-specific serine/threonine protein kinase n=1 Tax=Stephania yunnanensis TaxID=152371 RepID=A0AAP0EBK0_9MAGN